MIRSNRLDVCVPEPPATGCTPPPADDAVPTPPPPEDGEGEEEEEVEEPAPPSGGAPKGPSTPVAETPSQVEPARAHVRAPQLNRRRIAQGLVSVSWKVLDPGVGITGWTISSQRLGRRGAAYVTRASGKNATAATLRLPPGGAYRLRFTVTDLRRPRRQHRDRKGRGTRRAVRALAASLFLAVLLVAGSAAAAPTQANESLDATVRYLQELQDTSGGFAEPWGQKPSQGISAWVALALAAAGINPQDQARCGKSAFEYLEGHFGEGLEEELAWPQIAVTSFERELMVVDAAGADPHHFAGYDLVAEILGRQLEDGAFAYTPDGTRGESNDTIFAILALSPIHEPAVAGARGAAREWVVSAQLEDGGWYYSGSSPHSEVDMTGAAIEALVAAGPPGAEPALGEYQAAIARGLEYLERSQLSDGGFPALPNGESESNVASTAWAVQAIWAVGQDPEIWTTGPKRANPSTTWNRCSRTTATSAGGRITT